MKHILTRNIKTPTTAVGIYQMAKDLVSLMTCPLGGPNNSMRIYRIEQAFEGLSDAQYAVVTKYIDRKLESYYEPNTDGFSAYDMDIAIMRM